VQVSYDGAPIHDIYRTLRGGKLTSTVVRNNILKLDNLGVPITIKSTVTPPVFKYLDLAYYDILDIWSQGTSQTIFRGSRFFPTIDYHNLEKYTESELEIAKKELEDSLVRIAKKDIDYFKKYNRFFFAWFGNNKALCSAGRDMVTVDWDGKVYKCHGCLYDSKKEDHFVTDLNSDDFVKKLESSNKFHCQDFGFLPIECKNCDAPFCLKCNVVKYDRSDKDQYLYKWRDYPVQKTLCDLYKINGKVWMAINQILKGN
jgi:radical SAM protein with 4Fe4S-binding SPASM domain